AAFAAGELVWTGLGRLGGDDAWIRLHLADALPLGLDADALEEAAAELPEGSPAARVLALLRATPGALRHGEILTALADEGEAVDPAAVQEALWDLAFRALITNDSFEALRSLGHGPAPSRSPRPGARARPLDRPRAGAAAAAAVVQASRWALAFRALITNASFEALRSFGHGPAPPRSPRAGARSRPLTRRGAARLSAAMMRQGASSVSELVPGPVGAGRWSALRVEAVDPGARAAALATLLLDRHGVVTRGAMDVEDVPGGFAAVYRVLAALEENGSCRRGYFVDGLGASQFAPVEAVDRLRDR